MRNLSSVTLLALAACAGDKEIIPCSSQTDCSLGSRCVQGACSEGPNQAPLAVELNYTTGEDTTLRADADQGLAKGGSDPEGETLRFRTLSQPSLGALTVETNGSFVYTPEPDAHGDVTFNYVAIDGELESAPARVTITVTPVNDLPIAEAQSVRTPEGESIEVELTALDADGDTLQFSVARAPLSGSVEGEGSAWTYRPAEGFIGQDEFLFVVSDGEGVSAPAAVTIEVFSLNEAPVAGEDRYEISGSCTLVVAQDEGFLANDQDPEGESLVFEIVTEPEHGRLELVEDEPGAFTYTPLEAVPEDRFTYSISDGRWTTESNVILQNTGLNGGGMMVSNDDGGCRLADAVVAMQNDQVVGACDPTGHERILLSDPVSGYALEETLVIRSGTVRVVGCGVTSVVSGSGERQIFRVEEAGTLELVDMSLAEGRVSGFGGAISSFGNVRLQGVSIRESVAMGGDGGNGGRGAGGGGGGGAGLGGAVFVGGGTFTAEASERHECRFVNNRVNGGNAGGGAANGGQFSGPGGSGGGPNGGQGGNGVGASGGLWSGGAGGGGSTQAQAGGQGGFGGGGGGGGGKTSGGNGGPGGQGGFGGGNGSQSCCSASAGGGGGAGFGGALFIESGEVTLNACLFESNRAVGGTGGGNAFGGGGTPGEGVGGALFVYGGTVVHDELRFESNEASLAGSEDLYEYD